MLQHEAKSDLCFKLLTRFTVRIRKNTILPQFNQQIATYYIFIVKVEGIISGGRVELNQGCW